MSASFNHDGDVARLERRVNELELRLSQLAILHRAAQAASSAVAVEQVYTDLARELGSALPRIDEIAIMECCAAATGVGISVGVCVHPGASRSAAELIEQADVALLRAKMLGKARVELAA